MKPTPSSLPDTPPVLAFGAHPDDTQLLLYALTRESEPDNISPVLIDISPPQIIAAWVATMGAHASQIGARNYVELQLTRARPHGLGAAVEYATALFPADPLVFASLSGLGRGARGF